MGKFKIGDTVYFKFEDGMPSRPDNPWTRDIREGKITEPKTGWYRHKPYPEYNVKMEGEKIPFLVPGTWLYKTRKTLMKKVS